MIQIECRKDGVTIDLNDEWLTHWSLTQVLTKHGKQVVWTVVGVPWEHKWRTDVLYWCLVYPLYITGKAFKNPISSPNTSVLDFLWCLLWVSKPEWAALFTLGGGICVTHCLRFTFGVTPADLLAASMTVEPFSSTYLQVGIDGAEARIYRAVTASVLAQADVLPTDLFWLGSKLHFFAFGPFHFFWCVINITDLQIYHL